MSQNAPEMKYRVCVFFSVSRDTTSPSDFIPKLSFIAGLHVSELNLAVFHWICGAFQKCLWAFKSKSS